jgi:hypothetical protein
MDHAAPELYISNINWIFHIYQSKFDVGVNVSYLNINYLEDHSVWLIEN